MEKTTQMEAQVEIKAEDMEIEGYTPCSTVTHQCYHDCIWESVMFAETD